MVIIRVRFRGFCGANSDGALVGRTLGPRGIGWRLLGSISFHNPFSPSRSLPHPLLPPRTSILPPLLSSHPTSVLTGCVAKEILRCCPVPEALVCCRDNGGCLLILIPIQLGWVRWCSDGVCVLVNSRQTEKRLSAASPTVLLSHPMVPLDPLFRAYRTIHAMAHAPPPPLYLPNLLHPPHLSK